MHELRRRTLTLVVVAVGACGPARPAIRVESPQAAPTAVRPNDPLRELEAEFFVRDGMIEFSVANGTRWPVAVSTYWDFTTVPPSPRMGGCGNVAPESYFVIRAATRGAISTVPEANLEHHGYRITVPLVVLPDSRTEYKLVADFQVDRTEGVVSIRRTSSRVERDGPTSDAQRFTIEHLPDVRDAIIAQAQANIPVPKASSPVAASRLRRKERYVYSPAALLGIDSEGETAELTAYDPVRLEVVLTPTVDFRLVNDLPLEIVPPDGHRFAVHIEQWLGDPGNWVDVTPWFASCGSGGLRDDSVASSQSIDLVDRCADLGSSLPAGIYRAAVNYMVARGRPGTATAQFSVSSALSAQAYWAMLTDLATRQCLRRHDGVSGGDAIAALLPTHFTRLVDPQRAAGLLDWPKFTIRELQVLSRAFIDTPGGEWVLSRAVEAAKGSDPTTRRRRATHFSSLLLHHLSSPVHVRSPLSRAHVEPAYTDAVRVLVTTPSLWDEEVVDALARLLEQLEDGPDRELAATILERMLARGAIAGESSAAERIQAASENTRSARVRALGRKVPKPRNFGLISRSSPRLQCPAARAIREMLRSSAREFCPSDHPRVCAPLPERRPPPWHPWQHSSPAAAAHWR